MRRCISSLIAAFLLLLLAAASDIDSGIGLRIFF